MKDFFGNELAVGDTVAYVGYGKAYLRKGVIEKLTEKCVKIKSDTSWRHPRPPPEKVVKMMNVVTTPVERIF
jgi:hypothetical protein